MILILHYKINYYFKACIVHYIFFFFCFVLSLVAIKFFVWPYVTCKSFQVRSSSLIEFSVSFISLCIIAYSVFSWVCNALYVWCIQMTDIFPWWKEWMRFFLLFMKKSEFIKLTRYKGKKQRIQQKKNGSLGMPSQNMVRTFFFSSQSSFSMMSFSLSGCSSCNNVETSSRVFATTFDKCVTKREISMAVALVISLNGFISSGKPLLSPSNPSAWLAGIYIDGCCAFNFSNVDAKSLYSI